MIVIAISIFIVAILLYISIMITGIVTSIVIILFQYYLSQISPITSKSLELIGVAGSSAGGSGQPGAMSARAPVVVSYSDSDEHDLFVVVDSAEKHITTMESYITFRVTTTVR